MDSGGLQTRRPASAMDSKRLLGLFLCVSALASGCASRRQAPEILYQGDELLVEEGRSLNITCRDSLPVAWCTDIEDLTSENYEETYEEGNDKPYTANLLIERVNFKHVGYYSCIHNTTENKMKQTCDVDDPLVSSIYVYVKDVDHLLTQESKHVFFHPTVGKPFTLPCKPTFPEVEVKLDKIQGNFSAPAYDTRLGYTIAKPTVSNHSGTYICTAHFHNKTQVSFISIEVTAQREKLVRPIVDVVNPWQFNSLVNDSKEHYDVIEGTSVNLTCSYDLSSSHIMRRLRWEIPKSITNETGNHRIYRNIDSGKSMNRTHIIVNADPEVDSGEYKCLVSSGNLKPEANIIVLNVLSKDTVNVKLKIDHPNVTTFSSSVLWQVYYRAYPKPVFTWYNEKMDVLVDSSKREEGKRRYKLDEINESGEMRLTIEKPDVTDIGEYMLVARASNNGEEASDSIKLLFTMPVEPSNIKLTGSSNHLMLKEDDRFLLHCEVEGYPKPEVQLEFKPCYSKDNCSDFWQLSEDDAAPYNKVEHVSSKDLNHRFKKYVTWNGRAEDPGYYRCVAFNDVAETTSTSLEFLVTDSENTMAYVSVEAVVNGEKYVSSNVVVLEGDNLIFSCFGNKMIIKNELRWMLNGNPLEEDLKRDWGLTVKKADSGLSYISEISIHNLTKIENFSLTCMEESSSEHSVTHLIKVNSMIVPKWKTGNDPPLQDYSLHEMGNLTMECSAEGAPTPEVTWYKDGEVLDKKLKHPEIIGSRILFHFLKTSDAGHYVCEVTNRAGTIMSESIVKVIDPDAFVDTNVLITIGVLVFILLVITVIFCRKIYQDRKRVLSLRLKEQKMFIEGDPESLNPEIGLDQQAELLPYDYKYEMPRDSIIFDKLLGVGAFGRVYRATAVNLIPGQAHTTVAVKMMKSRTDSVQLKALRSEVKIMIHIGRHMNIVNLLGACSKDLASKGELLLLVEYCKYGNILDYMHHHRKEFVNQINNEDKIDPSITCQQARQRIGSGSRNRTSRGLKYAHLNFNHDAVYYINGQTSDSDNSTQTSLGQPSSPLQYPSTDGELPGQFYNRTISTSSSHHITSDMSTLTFESSSGASDGYVSSRAVGSKPTNLCSKDLLCWAFQISKGMEYLSFKKVLHGDLAARNVLLAEDNIVKISDFGLAKDIYKDKNYKKKSDGPVPVKWLALECLRDCVFSTQSDVWSFGVVLWEIFSLGQNPYPGVEFDENFIVKLEKGVRLEQPKYSTYALYRIMLDCWSGDPMERPSFSKLEQCLGEILGEAERKYYLELNQPYQEDNTESGFLNFIQSPDYSTRVQGTHSNLDEDGYEMPFSPSPFPEGEIQNAHNPQIPRLTSLQIEFLQQETGMDSGSSAGTYLSMSSPIKMSQNVFNFDHEAVASITKQDAELNQINYNGVDEPDDEACDVYLNMNSKPKTNKSVSHENQENSPVGIKMKNVPVLPRSPSHQDNGSSSAAHCHKLIRTVSEIEKHDSGLYSPTACMQTNPNYMIMNSFPRTDEKNYLIRGDAEEIRYPQADQLQYMNCDAVNIIGKSVPREYMKEGRYDEEYTNLLPTEGYRGRTLSETSSGLGSISEEISPESKIKPDFLKSPVKENAILEEPVAA